MIDDLSIIINNSKKYKIVSFHEVVKSATGKDVLQLNINNTDDKELIDNISFCAKNYIIKSEQDNILLSGKIRINEIGNLMEKEFVKELIKFGMKARLLSKVGYPDIEIDKNRIIYLECKASAKKDCWTAPFRSFYFTEGKKIIENAIHLLIGWKLEKIDGNYKVIGFKIVDLYNIDLCLRCEFNSDNPHIYKNSIFSYP